jgi:serine/threonine protein kinase
LAELLAREPLFPGEDYLKQLEIICKKIGKPTEKDLSFVTSQRAKEYILSLPIEDRTPSRSIKSRLYDMFPKYSQSISSLDDESSEDEHEKAKAAEDVLDIMSKMLRFSPDERISVLDALEHPFLESMHNEDDEPDANFHATFKFELENMDGKSEEYLIGYYKQLIWDEIREFHPDLAPTAPAGSSYHNSSAAHLSPATIAYNYHKSMAAVNGTTTPEQQRQELFITSITPGSDDAELNQPLAVYSQDSENRYDAMNGPSSVATVITTKTNLTASNAIREVRVAQGNVNAAVNRPPAKRPSQGVTTPMSPPTSLPSKRFKTNGVNQTTSVP